MKVGSFQNPRTKITMRITMRISMRITIGDWRTRTQPPAPPRTCGTPGRFQLYDVDALHGCLRRVAPAASACRFVLFRPATGWVGQRTASEREGGDLGTPTLIRLNIVPARKKLQRPPGVCMLMHARAQTKTRGNPDCTRSVRSTQAAAVMVLLDASAIARNFGSDLIFASSRCAARSHSDLGGYADGAAATFRCSRVPRSG